MAAVELRCDHVSTTGPPCPTPQQYCPRQTRHGGCSHTQSSCVYQKRSSRSGRTFAAARAVAWTEGSRCSVARIDGNFWQRWYNARQPLNWTSPLSGCRRRAPSSACAVGSGGKPVRSRALPCSRIHSASAASAAAFASWPRTVFSTRFSFFASSALRLEMCRLSWFDLSDFLIRQHHNNIDSICDADLAAVWLLLICLLKSRSSALQLEISKVAMAESQNGRPPQLKWGGIHL